MTVDLERELRLAMEQFTSDVHPSPDLLVRLHRPRRRVGARWAATFATATAAAVIAAVVVVGEHTGGGSTATGVRPLSTYKPPSDYVRQEKQAAQSMNDAITNWGPTRGDKAGDSTLLAQLRAEWARPTQHPQSLGSFEPVQSPDGPMRVLWAASTPEGVAALAVQHTRDPVADYWYGIFLPGTSGQPRLAQRGQLTAGFDFGEFDPHLLSFTLSPAHDAVVVVPMNADDTVRVAFRTIADAKGQLVPRWTDASVRDGAAIATVPPRGNVWGTVVEVRHGGQVVADHRIDFVATHLQNEGPPQPANELGLWCNGCSVGGGEGPGYSMAMLDAWAVRHGPVWLPVWFGQWSIGAHLRDGHAVLAAQLWQSGQPAHTVVLVDGTNDGEIQVLYDAVTDAKARPVLAVRLPQASGWLVGAGPGATVTGWRSTDGDWHDVKAKKAVLVPTDSPSIQLRLVVNGKTVVVTR